MSIKPQAYNRLVFIIEGEIHSSKNSRRVLRMGNRTVVSKSLKAKEDEGVMAVYLWQQKTQWEIAAKGKKYPLYVHFFFARRTKGKWDFVNLVQGVADAMVKAGYIPDDDVEHFIPVYAGHTVDKENPNVSFWIGE